jgi:hypothetical protein
MKIKLGTIELGSLEREAINAHEGLSGRASRETCRGFVLYRGWAGIEEAVNAFEGSPDYPRIVTCPKCKYEFPVGHDYWVTISCSKCKHNIKNKKTKVAKCTT